MKKVIAILVLLSICGANLGAQGYDKQCYYGISFEKSENKNWGYGELVITDVEANSPAEAAGIKVNDIIMEINGKATFLRDNVTIAEWLFDNPDPVVTFTIRNVDTYFKEYTLHRECITVNSVGENYLASIFSLYSLENTRQQKFTLPLKVNPTPEIDFTDYHTYNFYDDGVADPSPIDSKIRAILEENFQKIGLKKNTENPDIWVNLYYEYVGNPHFTGMVDPSASGNALRFNTETKQMVKLPIYDPKDLNYNIKGQYIAKLGFTFYDRKNIDSTKFTQLWECNIEDYLSANYSLEEYARFHVPLMMMQYPYSEVKSESDYFVNISKYNYTGIHFDIDNMSQINDVEMDSPAFAAGIRPGYRIQKLNGKNFNFTKDEITNGYRHFLEATESYRDQSTKFVGIEGYEECMYWNVGYYPEIVKQFNKSEYVTSFSYLYDFAKYINPKYDGTLLLEAWDGIQKRLFTIKPTINESVVIKAL